MNKIGFIGAGHMACSIISGLLKAGFNADSIRASDPAENPQSRQLGIKITADNQALAKWSDIIILAVKPQVLRSICTQISTQIKQHHLILSIAAGIHCTSITNWLATDIACIRFMPNAPASLGLGMSGLYANPRASKEQVRLATNIMQTTGQVIQFHDEAIIDTVTAISGSGPAYYFLLMEAMIEAGVQQGLSRNDAKSLVLQTAIGATTMAQQPDTDIQELRQRVTSPGGTTEQAIKTLMDGHFMQLISNAIDDAAKRAAELSHQMDDNE